MNVLIVEDEAVAVKRLEKILTEVAPEINVIARTGSVKESVRWLMKNKPDLIFMDIQLSDGISFNIFDQLDVTMPVIFTTAYDQYAIKAFEANSLGYLLKPVRSSELKRALEKYNSFYKGSATDFNALWEQIRTQKPAYKQRFMVQRGEKILHVSTSEMAYMYAIQKDVFATTFDNKSYALDFTLEKLSGMLDPEMFFRINRKFIININAIDSMVARSRGRIKVNLNPPADDPEEAVVSVDRSPDFKKWLDK